MKKIILIVLCVVLLVIAAGCFPIIGGGGGTNGGSDFSGSDFSDETTAKNNDFYKNYSKEEKDLYYLLWKDTTKISVKIDIEPKELVKINEGYNDAVKAEIYRKCNLTITVNGKDYVFDEVGIRMHGNTSRRDFCNGEGKIYAFVHFRFNLTETFDGEGYGEGEWGNDIAKTWTEEARLQRKNRSFATLEKFYFKWNKNYDNSYVREVYANKMFQAYGVLAPHITLAQMSLKQQGTFENLGVGMLYETVDKHFIKRNFSSAEAKGDLYKCGYQTAPANLTTADGRGVEAPGQKFNYALKTNTDRTSPEYGHHKHLMALIDILKTSKTAEDFRSKLESVVDMGYFTNFEAVNYLLGNPDCIRNNSNNYYLYFLPNGKMFFIPYDYDRCLGINVDWNPSGNGMTTITPYSVNGAAGKTSNPLYTKTILSSGTDYYRNMYQSKLQKVLNGEWFTYAHFQTVFQNYKNNYAKVVLPSQNIQNQCGGNVKMNRLEFSERGTSDLGSRDDNLTTQNYIELKRKCALDNL